MYVFYPDVFFFHNVILIGLISVFSFQLMKIPIKDNYLNLVLGALIGSIVETLLLLLSANYTAFTILSQIILVPLILWMELKKHPAVSKRRAVLISYTTVFLFIGATNAMEYVFHLDAITQTGIGAIAIIVETILLEFERGIQVQKCLYQVELGNAGKQIWETAFYDSGNCLRDPWKHRAVHIVSESLLQKLQLIDPVLLVPYQSLGNKDGVLEVYEAEWIIVLSKGKAKRLTNVLLGKAEESLLKSKQYQMILHESVFEDGGC